MNTRVHVLLQKIDRLSSSTDNPLQLLAEGKVEAAFQMAIQFNNLPILENLLEKLPPPLWSDQLTEDTRLSVLQQLCKGEEVGQGVLERRTELVKGLVLPLLSHSNSNNSNSDRLSSILQEDVLKFVRSVQRHPQAATTTDLQLLELLVGSYNQKKI